ncbi:MAG: DUF2835 domain-containing protein [Gammaproteobacteria bacterium]|nr:DUF2835 domain-containing protein [Gammaproteobacteria bacterium]
MNRTYEFTMQLSAEKTRIIYQGQARFLLVTTDHGIKLQLPAQNFRSYVTNEGINGRFSVEIDEDNKILQLSKSV